MNNEWQQTREKFNQLQCDKACHWQHTECLSNRAHAGLVDILLGATVLHTVYGYPRILGRQRGYWTPFGGTGVGLGRGKGGSWRKYGRRDPDQWWKFYSALSFRAWDWEMGSRRERRGGKGPQRVLLHMYASACLVRPQTKMEKE